MRKLPESLPLRERLGERLTEAPRVPLRGSGRFGTKAEGDSLKFFSPTPLAESLLQRSYIP